MGCKRPRVFRINPCIFAILPAFALSLGCWSSSNVPLNLDQEGGTTAGTGGIEKPEASDRGGAIILARTEMTGSVCPSHNLTQPCSCIIDGDRIAGRQTCDRFAGWSECECTAINHHSDVYNNSTGDPITNKEVALFRWNETVPSLSGLCKAGHYLGVFTGFYNSPAMGADDVSFSPVGIPVVGTVEFNLYQVGSGEYFDVKDGAMEGFALVVIPFKGDLVGTVNCDGEQPLMEIGLKNGVYYVGDTNYYFEGKSVWP